MAAWRSKVPSGPNPAPSVFIETNFEFSLSTPKQEAKQLQQSTHTTTPGVDRHILILLSLLLIKIVAAITDGVHGAHGGAHGRSLYKTINSKATTKTAKVNGGRACTKKRLGCSVKNTSTHEPGSGVDVMCRNLCIQDSGRWAKRLRRNARSENASAERAKRKTAFWQLIN